MSFLLATLAELAQLVLLLLLAPFLTDLSAMLFARLAGRAMPPLGARWRQLRRNWRTLRPVPPLAWLSLLATGMVLAALPLGTARTNFSILSDPLALGMLLIAARLPVWFLVVVNRQDARRDHQARHLVAQDMRAVALLLPLLALSDALMAIGLPGAGNIAGLVRDMPIQPAPALTGALVFVAAALLAILQNSLLPPERFETLIPEAEGRARAVLRYGHDLTACGWILLLADLAWPESIAGESAGTRALLTSWLLTAPLRLLGVATLAATWRALAPPHPLRAALTLAGAATLLVLAGRFAA